MRYIVVCLVLSMGAGFVAAQPSEATGRPPELDSLGFFVGTWTVDLPGDDTYTETCGWAGDRRHVVCNNHQEGPSGTYDGTMVLSYVWADSTLRLYQFAGRGDPEVWVGRMDGRSFVFTVDAGTAAFPAQRRMTMTPTDAGYDVVGEESRLGGPWVELVRFSSARAE